MHLVRTDVRKSILIALLAMSAGATASHAQMGNLTLESIPRSTLTLPVPKPAPGVCYPPAVLIANPGLIRTPQDAQMVIDQLLAEAGKRDGKMSDWAALTRAMEVLSPQSSTRDITRYLRRIFYGDNLFEFIGITLKEGEPNVSADLKRYEWKLGPLKRWQEVESRGGKTDFGHALVALDAYAWQPNPLGRSKAWLFTYFGDAATGVASALGFRDAGDNNEPDQRGNALGHNFVYAYGRNESMSLSGLVAAADAPPQIMAKHLSI